MALKGLPKRPGLYWARSCDFPGCQRQHHGHRIGVGRNTAIMKDLGAVRAMNQPGRWGFSGDILERKIVDGAGPYAEQCVGFYIGVVLSAGPPTYLGAGNVGSGLQLLQAYWARG